MLSTLHAPRRRLMQGDRDPEGQPGGGGIHRYREVQRHSNERCAEQRGRGLAKLRCEEETPDRPGALPSFLGPGIEARVQERDVGAGEESDAHRSEELEYDESQESVRKRKPRESDAIEERTGDEGLLPP